MAYIEADCSIIKHDGQIIGVSLVAQPQTEAEMFCGSMPKRIVEDKAGIKFENGKIIFVNLGEGEVSFAINDEDASALQTTLFGDNIVGLYRDGFLTPGFKIVIEGMENNGTKTELTRL